MAYSSVWKMMAHPACPSCSGCAPTASTSCAARAVPRGLANPAPLALGPAFRTQPCVLSTSAGLYWLLLSTATADRNLFVHQIALNGQAYSGDASTNNAGYNQGTVAGLYSNGDTTFYTSATVVTGKAAPLATDSLVLRVSGDAWNGTPHFAVLVDGKQVGGTLTTSASHAAGQTQDIALTGTFGAGAHSVAVRFLDDAWGGTATADRNLFVHQITLNGHAYSGDAPINNAGYNQGAVAGLYSNGDATFHTAASDMLWYV